jgi:hypothetical protein
VKLLEAILGVPLAAPETAVMRRLRFLYIASAACSCLGIVAIDQLVRACGRVAVGAGLLGLLVIAALSGAVFFWKKNRIDDAWLLNGGFDREGEGA